MCMQRGEGGAAVTPAIPDDPSAVHYSRVDQEVAHAVQFWVMHTYVPRALQSIEEYSKETLRHILKRDISDVEIQTQKFNLAHRVRNGGDQFNALVQQHISVGKGHGLPFTSVVLKNQCYIRCVPTDVLWKALQKVFPHLITELEAMRSGRIWMSDPPRRIRNGISRREQLPHNPDITRAPGLYYPHANYPPRAVDEEENMEFYKVRRKTIWGFDGSMVWAGEQAGYLPTYVLVSCGTSDSWTNPGDVGVQTYGPQPQLAQHTWLEFMVIWDIRVKRLFLALIPDHENLTILEFSNAMYGISGLLGRSEYQVCSFLVVVERWYLDERDPEDEADWDRFAKDLVWGHWDELVNIMDAAAVRVATTDDPSYMRFIELCPDQGTDHQVTLGRTARWRLGNGDWFWARAHRVNNATRFRLARTSSDGRIDPGGNTPASSHLVFSNRERMVYDVGC